MPKVPKKKLASIRAMKMHFNYPLLHLKKKKNKGPSLSSSTQSNNVALSSSSPSLQQFSRYWWRPTVPSPGQMKIWTRGKAKRWPSSAASASSSRRTTSPTTGPGGRRPTSSTTWPSTTCSWTQITGKWGIYSFGMFGFDKGRIDWFYA